MILHKNKDKVESRMFFVQESETYQFYLEFRELRDVSKWIDKTCCT